ncbi:MAG: hypothetical protein ACYC1C_14945, partial [Chloroflexota bacterium]
VNSTWETVVLYMVVLGLGIGGLMPILNVAVQNAFPYRQLGVVNASQQFVRSLGAVIATPILGAVLANSFAANLQANLTPALRQAIATLPASVQTTLKNPQSLTNAESQAALRSTFDAFGPQGAALYQQFINALHQALAAGIRELFFIAFLFGIATLVATFFLPEIPLQREEFYAEADAMQAEGRAAGQALALAQTRESALQLGAQALPSTPPAPGAGERRSPRPPPGVASDPLAGASVLGAVLGAVALGLLFGLLWQIRD